MTDLRGAGGVVVCDRWGSSVVYVNAAPVWEAGHAGDHFNPWVGFWGPLSPADIVRAETGTPRAAVNPSCDRLNDRLRAEQAAVAMRGRCEQVLRDAHYFGLADRIRALPLTQER